MILYIIIIYDKEDQNMDFSWKPLFLQLFAFLEKLLGSFLYRFLGEKPQTYISANAFFNLKDLSFLMMKPELQLNSYFLRSLELQEIQNRKFITFNVNISSAVSGWLLDHRSKEFILTRGNLLYIFDMLNV